MASKKEKEEKLKRIKEERHKRRASKRFENKKKRKSKKEERFLRKKSKQKLRELGLKIIKGRSSKRNKGVGLKRRGRRTENVSIQEAIPKGIGRILIHDINKEKENELNLKYEQMFKKLAVDKRVMKDLIREENIQKINWRFEGHIRLYNRQNEILGEFVKGSGTSLLDVKQTCKGLKEGRETSNENYFEDIKQRGYMPVGTFKRGNIYRTEVELIFRKGGEK